MEDLLPYPLADVEAVSLEVGRSERKDGENAFPPIAVLERMLNELTRTRRERSLTGEVAQWKAVWERERAEDIANGIPRGTAESELADITKPKRAVPRYTPEQEAALERMRERVVVGTEGMA